MRDAAGEMQLNGPLMGARGLLHFNAMGGGAAALGDDAQLVCGLQATLSAPPPAQHIPPHALSPRGTVAVSLECA